MTMSVSCVAFGGRVIYEDRGSAESTYMRDPLGNTVGLMDETGNRTDSWTYWPYGEVQSHSGPSTTPLTFLGTLGYFVNYANMLYVRARHLRTDLTRRMTVDPFWPSESAYSYARWKPTYLTDRSGSGFSLHLWASWPGLILNAFGSCILGGVLAWAISYLEGNNPGDQGCKAFGDCIASILGAVLGTLLGGGSIVASGCISGIVAGVGAAVTTRFCDTKNSCETPSLPCLQVGVLARAVGGFISGFLGATYSEGASAAGGFLK